jgi:hypothetical protein
MACPVQAGGRCRRRSRRGPVRVREPPYRQLPRLPDRAGRFPDRDVPEPCPRLYPGCGTDRAVSRSGFQLALLTLVHVLGLPLPVRLVVRDVGAQFAEFGWAGGGLVHFPLPVERAYLVIERPEVPDDRGPGVRSQAAQGFEHRHHVYGEIDHPDLVGRVQPQVVVEGAVHPAAVPDPPPGGGHRGTQRADRAERLRLSRYVLLHHVIIRQRAEQR